ncbi:hypothetical protein ES705_04276 [subsurface metagenome]|nr:hypothetical protein [Methanosarcinales archaeon]
MTITLFLLYLLSFLLIYQFAGYPSLMAVAALKSKPKNNDYSFLPFVSVIVPTYNEENVIAKRIENLVVLDYPKDNYIDKETITGIIHLEMEMQGERIVDVIMERFQ